jgi:import inner membrane translocase subunit TIM23
MTAAALNLTYEEEFEDMSDISKNIICGVVTGAIYKSSLGMIPMGVGAILGGSMIGGMTLLNQYAYERGYVNFEMKI